MHLYYIWSNYNDCWLKWPCVLFTNLKLSYHTDLSDFWMFIVSTNVTVWRRIELLHLFNVLVCICVPKLQSELVCFLSRSMLRLQSWNALNFSSGSLFTWIPEKKKKKIFFRKNHAWCRQSLFPKGTTADIYIYIPDCKYKVNTPFKSSMHKYNVVLLMSKGNKKQKQISCLAKWLLPGLICICVSLLILHPRQTADKSNKRSDM